MRYALGKAAFFRGKPISQGARGRGESCAFSQAENHAAHDQRGKAPDEANGYSGTGPDDSADCEREARAEFITQPSTPDLQRQIRPPERGEYPPHLNSVDMQIALDRWARGVHVDPIDIGKPIHRSEEHTSELQ